MKNIRWSQPAHLDLSERYEAIRGRSRASHEAGHRMLQTAEDKDNKSMKDQNSLLEQIRDAVRVKERIPVSKQTGRSSR